VLDVPGVGLGHATVLRDEPDPPVGRGVARTGVTVLRLGEEVFTRPVPCGGAVLNGAGELTGLTTAREWRVLETPVLLTSTMQVGRVYDAACTLMLEEEPAVADDVVIPVVGECDDSWLSDVRRMQVAEEDVRHAWHGALLSASTDVPPAEGAVGAGTGMLCLGFKGGIGTASRVVPSGHTVAVLLLTNFGERDRLTIGGVPIGQLLPPDVPGTSPDDRPGDAGSCIGVVVTDAPLDGADCERLARRVGLGLARTGSVAYHGSGEIFLAAALGLRTDRDGRLQGTPMTGRDLDPLFAAVVEASEEAVVNSLLAAVTTTGRLGRVAHALPADRVQRLLADAGRLHG
jgi:D-aminopeptidase